MVIYLRLYNIMLTTTTNKSSTTTNKSYLYKLIICPEARDSNEPAFDDVCGASV